METKLIKCKHFNNDFFRFNEQFSVFNENLLFLSVIFPPKTLYRTANG